MLLLYGAVYLALFLCNAQILFGCLDVHISALLCHFSLCCDARALLCHFLLCCVHSDSWTALIVYLSCEHSGPPVQVSDTVSVWCLGRGILADKKQYYQ